MADYKVVISKNIKEFEKKCTELLENGYIASGAFAVDNKEYMQAFVLYDGMESTTDPESYKVIKRPGRPPKALSN